MTYDYLITLKKTGHSFADQVSLLLYVFAIAAFGFFAYQNPRQSLVYIAVIISIVATLILALIKKRKKGEAYFRLGLFIAVVGWLAAPQRNVWMATLYAIAGILEKQVKFPQEIGFTETEISFNSFPGKKLNWSEVSNIIVKDGLITIDKKNNQLYQKEIEGYVTKDVENEFNEFCRKQVEKC